MHFQTLLVNWSKSRILGHNCFNFKNFIKIKKIWNSNFNFNYFQQLDFQQKNPVFLKVVQSPKLCSTMGNDFDEKNLLYISFACIDSREDHGHFVQRQVDYSKVSNINFFAKINILQFLMSVSRVSHRSKYCAAFSRYFNFLVLS